MSDALTISSNTEKLKMLPHIFYGQVDKQGRYFSRLVYGK